MTTPLKPQSAPKAKLPKARVFWSSTQDLVADKISTAKWSVTDFPVVVLPCPTAKQARELVKVWNMTPSIRNLIIGDAIAQTIGSRGEVFDYPKTVNAVLSALGFPSDTKEGK